MKSLNEQMQAAKEKAEKVGGGLGPWAGGGLVVTPCCLGCHRGCSGQCRGLQAALDKALQLPPSRHHHAYLYHHPSLPCFLPRAGKAGGGGGGSAGEGGSQGEGAGSERG